MSTISISKDKIIELKEFDTISELKLKVHKLSITKLFTFKGYRDLTYDETSDVYNSLEKLFTSNINILSHIQMKKYTVIDISDYTPTQTYIIPSDYHFRRDCIIINGVVLDKKQLLEYLSNKKIEVTREILDKSNELKIINESLNTIYCDASFNDIL